MHAVTRELLRQSIGAVLRPAEDQDLLPVVRLDEMREQLALALTVDRMLHLRHELGRRVATRDLDRDGLVHEGSRELADLFRERGREQQVLPLRRQ